MSTTNPTTTKGSQNTTQKTTDWVPRTPLQPRDNKILHRKLKIEYHEPHYNQGITKYYTENYRLSTTNPTTTKGSQNTTQKTKDWVPRTPLQPRDNKILHRKLKIEYHEPHYNQGITKYYTENYRLSTTNPTTTKGSQNTTQKTKDWVPRTPLQPRDHKILHRKLKIEYHEPHYNQGITKYYTEN